jgi:hypothetical protein
MSISHLDNTMNIKEFKNKFGHHYSYDALKTMTGVKKFGDRCYIPTYEKRNRKVIDYYESLIKEFSILYNQFNKQIDCITNYNGSNSDWYNGFNHDEDWYCTLQPQHVIILNFIKNGNVDGLCDINSQGWYIGFYKDCMLKVAIDNKQIEIIDYLIRTKQINRDIDGYILNTTPQFYDMMVSKYHIKFKQEYEKSLDKDFKKQLYLFFSNLHWIDPEETYLNLKYYRVWDNTEPYDPEETNPELLLHIIHQYKIDENHMCNIIKQSRNSQRYIAYCFRNNKICELKSFFETEYLENEWNSSKVFNLIKTCIHYNCLELLDSIKVNIIHEYDTCNYNANLIFYKKKIREILKDDNDAYNLIKQKYDTIFHDFENICM